mmetsp:Transcript_100891/g.314523  ORF Transcript_100891/g.314523 Transcript_100891/m.314523 type:complete len:234 (+) Transcript_100891:151-852(+)
METLDVVPILLQQGDKEIDGHQQITPQLFGAHADIPYRGTKAKDLLQLPFHLTLRFSHLCSQVVRRMDNAGKLAGPARARTKDTRYLRNQGLRCQKAVVRFLESPHELLVPVQLLEIVHAPEWDACTLRLLAMDRVPDDADGQARARCERKGDSAAEAPVARNIVVPEPNLQVHGLEEPPRLGPRALQDRGDAAIEVRHAELAAHRRGGCRRWKGWGRRRGRGRGGTRRSQGR